MDAGRAAWLEVFAPLEIILYYEDKTPSKDTAGREAVAKGLARFLKYPKAVAALERMAEEKSLAVSKAAKESLKC
jgi:hypothetical protein